ncbi:NUDIX domain-containing protein [Coralliovum pocilloporae]|uniref:NUDIX domain-containing protein n=1 Tax=Coralliovum pocilloporae TaxID=3066369 RepID=UPI0033077C21
MTAFHRLFKVMKPLIFRFWLLKRGATLGVRAVVLDGEGQVFLVRHTYLPGWYLPGGGVEAGQSFLTALKQELSEEGNIRLTGAPDLFAVYQNRREYARDHVALYIVRDFVQDSPRRPDHEIAEARFFPLDDLPEDTTEATRRRLSEIRQNDNASALPEIW